MGVDRAFTVARDVLITVTSATLCPSSTPISTQVATDSAVFERDDPVPTNGSAFLPSQISSACKCLNVAALTATQTVHQTVTSSVPVSCFGRSLMRGTLANFEKDCNAEFFRYKCGPGPGVRYDRSHRDRSRLLLSLMAINTCLSMALYLDNEIP